VPVADEPLHRVVYSSTQLRVYDIVIPPHTSTLYHVHEHDLVGVTLTPEPMREEKEGSAPRDYPAGKPDAVWFASHPQRDVHRVTNLGDVAIHMVAVEPLIDFPAKAERAAAAGAVEFDNREVRVVYYSLKPGQETAFHARGSYVLVLLGAGRIANACGVSEARSIAQAGYVCVSSERSGHLSNVGDTPVGFLVFEIG